MLRHAWLKSWKLRWFNSQCVKRRRVASGLPVRRCLESLEARIVLTSDFGDAPYTTAGTGAGDYQTLIANGGPSHVIDATQTTLFLGSSVDGEADATQTFRANGDDITTLPDDGGW